MYKKSFIREKGVKVVYNNRCCGR